MNTYISVNSWLATRIKNSPEAVYYLDSILFTMYYILCINLKGILDNKIYNLKDLI